MSHFVLIHGGMLGGWYWKKVRLFLEAKGHRVWTPTLTGLGEKSHLNNPEIGLNDHVQDVVNILFYEDIKDVLLVGHSYGGMVITGVADQVPERIKKLIYVDALVPKNGESMFDIVNPLIKEHIENNALTQGNGWHVPPIPPENYGFSEPEDILWFKARTSAHPLKSFQERLALSSNKTDSIEKLYIKCAKDHALDSMLERVKNMKIPCRLLDTGHFPMITDPEKLTELLLA